ncbi:MAG: hypothetical protein DRO06_00205 [Thermoproteota archaeon]|nr:MAG: hypothetical protein DRO06_00205 [Candidatus Korarchaeota archaeon]
MKGEAERSARERGLRLLSVVVVIPPTIMLLSVSASVRFGLSSPSPLVTVSAMLVALFTFLMADKISSRMLGETGPEEIFSSFRKSTLMNGAVIPALGAVAVLSSRPSDALFTALIYMVVSYSGLAASWRKLSVSLES